MRRAHSRYPASQHAATASSHPALQGEGRIAEGNPGWGDGCAALDSAAAYAEPPPPAPGPLARGDLPLPGGGENGATFAANRARGRVSLALAATPRGTKRTTIREDGSLRVRFPHAGAGPPEAVLVNTAGGIAGGDRFAVDVMLGAGAQLTVTTAAAEKIYRSLGPDACVDVAASLSEGAELTWLPQETILFDRARLARTITIALAPAAKLLLAEMIVFGRSAMGETVHEGRIIDRWQIRRGGRLIFAESLRFDGRVACRLSEPAVAAGCTALGAVLIVPSDDAAVSAVRAASGRFRGEVGISEWNDIALARLVAGHVAALRHDLVVLLSAVGRSALPRIWLN